MPGVTRITDPNSGHNCWGTSSSNVGSPNVIVNGLPVTRQGDPWEPCPAHCPNTSDHVSDVVTGDPTVLVNGKPIARIGDILGCSSIVIGGSSNVMSCNVNHSWPPPQSEEEKDKADLEDEGQMQGLRIWPPLKQGATPTEAQIKQSKANGVDPDAPPATPAQKDDVPPVQTTPPPPDCGGLVPPFTSATRLSQNFTLGDLTIRTPAGSHPLRAQHGLTEAEIVCNLKQLCDNVLEPIRGMGYEFVVNSAFRNVQGKNSQHEYGQAADLRFNGKSNQEVFEIAQRIKNSGLPFGQMILEYPSRLPWIHVSFPERTKGSPFKVSTMDKNYKLTTGLQLYT
jgi:uncharacterized Zn-binding protein involved in type VI secretion